MHFFLTLVIVLILLKSTPFLYNDSMLLCCSDGLSAEDRLAWQNRLNNVKDNIDFWRNDVIGNNKNLEYLEEEKHTMTKEQYLTEKTDIETERRISHRNWKQEERMMNNLLAKGPQASTSTEASTAGTVRNISEVSGSNEQGPSKR